MSSKNIRIRPSRIRVSGTSLCQMRAATNGASAAGHRVVIPRIGLVLLGKEGGALAKMLMPFRTSGGQSSRLRSTMDELDFNRRLGAYDLWMLQTPSVSGRFNTVNEPVKNIDFTACWAQPCADPPSHLCPKRHYICSLERYLKLYWQTSMSSQQGTR